MPQFFTCICSTDKTTGKIYRRIEKSGAFHDEYTYSYDETGHLKEVFRNDMLRESYTYNGKGQRTLRLNGWEEGVIRYKYDDNGSLLGMICNNSRLFDYDEDGNLIRSRELVFQKPDKETKFFYQDTLLRGMILPDGTEFVYTYDQCGKNPVCPVAKYRNGKPLMQFVWKDIRQLESCVDMERGIRFDFAYKNGKLASVQLSRSGFGNGPDILSRLGGGGTLLAFCDQVGTPKLFTNKAGRHIKELGYDSFGVLDSDSLPELFIPIGFAGGLVDEDTGLVRFGFRDYDPSTGRFTCPDPLGDTGGDHDLYDYCVDDPVNKFDPLGLKDTAPEGGKKQSSQWKEPDWVDRASPFLRLPQGHPYRECERERLNHHIRSGIGTIGGYARIEIERPDARPWMPGITPEQQGQVGKHLKRLEEDHRKQVEDWQRRCGPVYDGSIYKE